MTSALLFGAGHLPTTATLMPLTPLVITRALLLNGLGGIVFGWLYWKRGLLAAMLAHFSRRHRSARHGPCVDALSVRTGWQGRISRTSAFVSLQPAASSGRTAMK